MNLNLLSHASQEGRASDGSCDTWCRRSVSRVILVRKITSHAGTQEIGVVCRRTKAYSLRSSAEQMAHVICQVLQGVCRVLVRWFDFLESKYLIQNDIVMTWTSCSLKAAMCLKEEIPGARLRDTTINNCASYTI